MDKFEQSTENGRCDKGIAWIKSCRECLFQVLCKFNSFYQKKDDNRQNKKDTMPSIH
jgi:hypothetical protein